MNQPLLLDKGTLRELVLDFYTTHDPKRLRDGIDISGMVNWTFQNGLAKLNEMLYDQYGAEIDPRKRVMPNSKDAFKRVSAALVAPLQYAPQDAERDEIRDRLIKFYEKYDPSKLSSLQKLVDFAMYRGVDLLNNRLMTKYGEDLSSFGVRKPQPGNNMHPHPMQQPSGFDSRDSGPPENINVQGMTFSSIKMQRDQPPPVTPRINPVGVPPPVTPRIDARPPPPPEEEYISPPPIPEEDTNLPPLPPQSMRQSTHSEAFMVPPPPMEDFIDPDAIEKELTRFYTFHDPGKLEVVEALASWALSLGKIKFNEKLLQLYGYNLDDPIPEKEEQQQMMVSPIPTPRQPPKDKTPPQVAPRRDTPPQVAPRKHTPPPVQRRETPPPRSDYSPPPMTPRHFTPPTQEETPFTFTPPTPQVQERVTTPEYDEYSPPPVKPRHVTPPQQMPLEPPPVFQREPSKPPVIQSIQPQHNAPPNDFMDILSSGKNKKPPVVQKVKPPQFVEQKKPPTKSNMLAVTKPVSNKPVALPNAFRQPSVLQTGINVRSNPIPSILVDKKQANKFNQLSSGNFNSKKNLNQKPKGGFNDILSSQKHNNVTSSNRTLGIHAPSTGAFVPSPQPQYGAKSKNKRVAAAVAPRGREPIKSMSKSTNCPAFQLDMEAKSFGTCVCGQPRRAHKNTDNRKVSKQPGAFKGLNIPGKSPFSPPMGTPGQQHPTYGKPPSNSVEPQRHHAPQPTYNNSPAPTYGAAPTYTPPKQPTYNSPAPTYGAAPTFTPPKQPTYNSPVYSKQKQPSSGYNQGFSQPKQPTYGNAKAPTYGQQKAPKYGNAPSYSQKQPSYSNSRQNPAQNNSQPTYGKPKPTYRRPSPAQNRAPAPLGGGGGACMNYQLDMTGATFGVCKCGFPRANHTR